VHPEAGAGEQQLANLEQQERYGSPAVAVAGDLTDGEQEALGLVGDALREVFHVAPHHV